MKRKLFFIVFLLISCFSIHVNAKEVDIYFFVDGGSSSDSNFKVVSDGTTYYDDATTKIYTDVIAYKDGTSYATYKDTDTIQNINSINGVSFQLSKSGKQLVSGKEWRAVNTSTGKTYYYSQSKTYKVSDILAQLDLKDQSYPAVYLLANWGNSSTTTAKSISIKASKSSISVKESLSLSVTYSPSNATKEKITWSSSDSKIATVDSNGKVTGVKAGKVTITAKSASGLKATVEITVSASSATTHYVIIRYHTNGGSLASSHGSTVTVSNQLVYVNKNADFYKIAYGKSTDSNGLANYNYKGYINIEKKGYQAVSGAEWNTKANGKGESFSQNEVYKASKFCDASKKNCTVTLYVNWVVQKYTISYKLDGGSVSGNPTSYTVESNKITLKTPTKKGYTFAGWTGTGLKTATKTVSIAKGSTGNRTYTATWTPNKVKIQLNMNGGSLASSHGSEYSNKNSFILYNKSTTIHTIPYGSSLGKYGLVDYDNVSALNVVRNGYVAKSQEEWNTKSDGSGKKFSQTKAYKASDFCDLSDGDCDITLYINWQSSTAHKVIIRYNTNGGTLASLHSSSISVSGEKIYYKNSLDFNSYSYGSSTSSSGLVNYNNSEYVNIVKNGYIAKNGAEWNTEPDGTGVPYSQSRLYQASDFCDASKKDCVVTLYVNWKKQKLTKIILDKTQVKLKSHESTSINASTDSTTDLVWTVSDTKIAKVSSSGVITGLSPGTTKVTVKSKFNSSISASVDVTVSDLIHDASESALVNKGTFDLTNYANNCIQVPTIEYNGVSVGHTQGFSIVNGNYMAVKVSHWDRNPAGYELYANLVAIPLGTSFNSSASPTISYQLLGIEFLGHANGMTYNSKTGKLYFTQNNNGNISVMNYSDFINNNKKYSELSVLQYNRGDVSPVGIAYDSSNQKTYISEGKWIYVYNYDMTVEEGYITKAIHINKYGQDIGSYNGYILSVRFDPNSKYNSNDISAVRNAIDVYDSNTGQYKGSVLIKSKGELESVDYNPKSGKFALYFANVEGEGDFDCISEISLPNSLFS